MNMHKDNQPFDTDQPNDELDALLREWHDVNAQQARAGRDELLRKLELETPRQAADDTPPPPPLRLTRSSDDNTARSTAGIIHSVRRFFMNPYTPAAASLMLLVAIAALIIETPQSQAFAERAVVMVPEGGRLNAIDDEGNIVGPCPLKHTDVDVDISGRFTRVTLNQTYSNPYSTKIEAVYTFPLGHRAAVDQMTMTIGDRVVVGEVKERQKAREIYEAAKAQNYVASLLEQERPNIFTQSVANIEPGVEVVVQISYVELLQDVDGLYRFEFPMVVGPRYIPGTPTGSSEGTLVLPATLRERHGVILLGPATLSLGAPGDTSKHGTLNKGQLQALFSSAQPIATPEKNCWQRTEDRLPAYTFQATYADGSQELGCIYDNGTGQINGRWFFIDLTSSANSGGGFSPDTDQVPDASRITPMPVRPDQRAGHDISVNVHIDSGGPAIRDVKSELHEIHRTDPQIDAALTSEMSFALANKSDIPNRDFVLSWRLADDSIAESTFTHTGPHGNFFTLLLQPPARVDNAQAVPRELIFVLDTSGSMNGEPINKAKAVMRQAIDSMRPTDTFNMITFAGDTHILWDKPRPATQANINEAQQFLANRQSGGGTEMMKAIHAALTQLPNDAQPRDLTPRQLVNLPADGRTVVIVTPLNNIHQSTSGEYTIPITDDLKIDLALQAELPMVINPEGVNVRLHGEWLTLNGRRTLLVRKIDSFKGEAAARVDPMRIVMFLTDGYVGNDEQIIAAVRENAKTTRVFSFGIGNSINRFLLDGMAEAGRGEVEYVLLNSDSSGAVERFVERISTPVLANIELEFSDGLEVIDLLPTHEAIPDLFDVKPLVLHGRYTKPGKGTLTIRGITGAGPYERVINLELPETQPEHDVIATLWAREKIKELEKTDDQAGIIAVGEQFQIMSKYTSFVAVEKSRMTIGGRSMLVTVPIEFPDGLEWEGFFGSEHRFGPRERAVLSHAMQQDAYRNTNELPQKLAYLMTRADELVATAGLEESDAEGLENEAMRGRVVLGLTAERVQAGAPVQLSQHLHKNVAGEPAATAVPAPSSPPVSQPAVGGSAGGNQFGMLSSDAPKRRAPGRIASVGDKTQIRDELAAGERLGQQVADDERLNSDPNRQLTDIHETLFFSEPAERDADGTQPTDQVEMVATLVKDSVASHRWIDHDGSELDITATPDGKRAISVVQQTENTDRALADANMFLHFLQSEMPDNEAVQTFEVPEETKRLPAPQWFEHDATIDASDAAVHAGVAGAAPQVTIVYDVRDLVRDDDDDTGQPNDARAQQLINLIQQLIDPTGWRDHGGSTSQLHNLDGNLVITSRQPVHDAIANLLSNVRSMIATDDITASSDALPLGIDNATQPSRSVTKMYKVADILQHESFNAGSINDSLNQLASLIVRTIDTASWRATGGSDGAMLTFNNLLIIQHTPEHIADVDGLLVILRTLLNLEDNAQMRAAFEQRQRLERVPDESLHPFIFAASPGEDVKIPETFRTTDGRLLVSVLLQNRKLETLSALEAAGLVLEDTSTTRDHIVGSIVPQNLRQLALIQQVRRIEPLRKEKPHIW